MEFDYIPKKDAAEKLGYIRDEDKFYRFVDEYNLVGVEWSQPTTISASYFARLLISGSSERARGFGRGNHTENDEYSNQLYKYYRPLLDHCAMWRNVDGTVICTAMPYGSVDSITDGFFHMKEEFDFPESIKLEFLDDSYRYRPNGDAMIVIYNGEKNETFDSDCSLNELFQKATNRSGDRRARERVTSSYLRAKYVSEYAKRRANGFCQLCGKPAPFQDKDGKPYLEAHHVIWLGEGGTDSLDNIVALCPNCHRKMHTLDLEEDVDKLLSIARSYKRNN